MEKFYDDLGKFIEKNKDEMEILNYVIENTDYITPEIIKFICDKSGIWDISLNNTIKFYPKFKSRLKSEEENKKVELIICTGMNCGPRGGVKLYEKMQELDVEGIELSNRRCFGRCKIGPNLSIDGEIYSHMNFEKLRDILKERGIKI